MALEQAVRRCPRCAGAVRDAAPWCTQCYLPLDASRPAGRGAPHGVSEASPPAVDSPSQQYDAPLPPDSSGRLRVDSSPEHDSPWQRYDDPLPPDSSGRPRVDSSPEHDSPRQQQAVVEPSPAAVPRGDRGWPCTACGHDNRWEDPGCADCGQPFLSGLTGQTPGLVLPGVGELSRLRRGQRVAVAAGVLLVGVVLLLLLSTVAGALLPS